MQSNGPDLLVKELVRWNERRLLDGVAGILPATSSYLRLTSPRSSNRASTAGKPCPSAMKRFAAR